MRSKLIILSCLLIHYCLCAQQKIYSDITYFVQIGTFSSDSLADIVPEINHFIQSGYGRVKLTKDRNDKYTVFAGYRKCFEEASILLENVKKSILGTKNTKVVAYDCCNEISLSNAQLRSECSGLYHDSDSIIYVPSYYYSALAFSSIDSIDFKKLVFAQNQFPNEEINIYPTKSCDGKNLILYRVFIGRKTCVQEAESIKEKLLSGGVLFSMAGGEKSPIYFYDCFVEKGMLRSSKHIANENCQ